MKKLILAMAVAVSMAACSRVNENNIVESYEKAIADRSNMMNKPGLMMYTLVLGDMNTPLAYMTTGRIVSGSKRLNAPDYLYCSAAGNCSWRAAPNLDGTYGSSGDYVYFWTTSGVYWQVPSNKVISSSHPIRLNDVTKIHVDVADAKTVASYNKSVEQSESAASK